MLLNKLKIYSLKTILYYLYLEFTYYFFQRLIKNSYSQLGEDLIIDQLLNKRKIGTFIDIGANHPKRFNNTYKFYKRGWTGINIEPNPNLIHNLNKKRPRDKNLNIGISTQENTIDFYIFNPNTLSTFSKNQADLYQKEGFELIEIIQIPVNSLASIFSTYFPTSKVDILSVDTENFDLIVLQSNDWTKYRPTILCVEKSNEELKEYIISKGYEIRYENDINYIFKLIE